AKDIGSAVFQKNEYEPEVGAKKKLSAVSEDKVRLVKNGHTYKVVLTWRGKTYMIQMFVPSVSRPTRQQVEKEIQKVYPDSKVLSFLPKEFDPANPTVMVGEALKYYASKRPDDNAKKLGLDFDLSGAPERPKPKEPEKRPYRKMSHAERVKDNKRIQAEKDAANPDKAEKQRKYQENLRKNPAVIARKKAIKQGRYPAYGNDISFADQGQKMKDVEASRKTGYHVNTPREVEDFKDMDRIAAKRKETPQKSNGQNKISGFDSGKQGGGVRRKVPNKPNTGGAEITG
ncbi:uncharacterized protein METZ01_LOCUS397612, partial [marine metagenome]